MMHLIKNAIEFGLRRTGYKEIRDHQRQVFEAYSSGKDVFLSAPTGSGKSLTFEVAPYIFDFMAHGEREDITCVCLVVVPLVALMKDQVSSLLSRGISVACVGSECTSEQLKDISSGKYSLVFGSPEALLNCHRSIFRGPLRRLLKAVFVDESHCIAKWGMDSKTEDAFRADYARIGELRSLLHRSVPFITLTATATEKVRKEIKRNLAMNECIEILGDPNKTNVRYAVVDIDKDNLYGTFEHIMKDLEVNQTKAEKVLVFCRRKERVKELYKLFSQCLGAKAYYRPTGEESIDDRSRLFGMYHIKTHQLVKQTVETEFCKEDGTVRVVFCTIAFGMGINVKGAYIGLHLGPSSGLDDYLQESGRIGRSAESMSHAVLLKFKGCTNSTNITKEMKDYVKNYTECRRKLLLKSFMMDPQSNSIKHTCCDICACSCRCQCTCGMEECVCAETCENKFQSKIEAHIASMKQVTNPPVDSGDNNELTRIAKIVLHRQLMDYRASLAHNVSHENLLTGLDLATGFSRKLVDSIVKDIHNIRCLQDLQNNFNFFSNQHAFDCWEIICSNVQSDSESDSTDSDDEIVRRTGRHRITMQLSSSSDGSGSCSD